jgi:hypothetical protein
LETSKENKEVCASVLLKKDTPESSPSFPNVSRPKNVAATDNPYLKRRIKPTNCTPNTTVQSEHLFDCIDDHVADLSALVNCWLDADTEEEVIEFLPSSMLAMS